MCSSTPTVWLVLRSSIDSTDEIAARNIEGQKLRFRAILSTVHSREALELVNISPKVFARWERSEDCIASCRIFIFQIRKEKSIFMLHVKAHSWTAYDLGKLNSSPNRVVCCNLGYIQCCIPTHAWLESWLIPLKEARPEIRQIRVTVRVYNRKVRGN